MADIPYLLQRAETEAVRAISSGSDGVAAVHQEMCLLYTGRVLAEMLSGARRRVGVGDAPPDQA